MELTAVQVQMKMVSNTYHKEAKTTTENVKVVVNVIVACRLMMEYSNLKKLIKSEALNFVAQDGVKIGKSHPKNVKKD